MWQLIFAIYFFVQADVTASAEDSQSHGNGKLVRRQSPRNQVSEVMQDGQVIPSAVRTSSESRKRIVRKRIPPARIASDDMVEQVTSDGRVLPASLEDTASQHPVNASLADTSVAERYERLQCCLLGSTCNQCQLGHVNDHDQCKWRGSFRCRYSFEAKRNPGNCCALGSSCNYCPNGRKHDTSCCSAGCFRCLPSKTPQIHRAGECCFLGSSCGKCPVGAQPNNKECAGKGNYRCTHADDCWYKCGWDGYCIHCETKENDDRACCRKGKRSIICDLIAEKKKKPDRHTCVDTPLASNTWVEKLKYTLVEKKTKTISLKNPITWSWLSWMRDKISLSVSFGPGILTGLNVKRVKILVDSPFVTIELLGVSFKVAFKGSFRVGSRGSNGTIDVGAPGGDIMVKFKLPTHHAHRDKNGNLIVGVVSAVETLDLEVGLKLGKFPRVAFTKLINAVKEAVKDGLIKFGKFVLGRILTRAVDFLDAEKPPFNKKHEGLMNAGDCCMQGGGCPMCPFGYESDKSKCANNGNYRCLEQPLTQLAGKCCAAGSSCYRCPYGWVSDNSCKSQGSNRCRWIADCWDECGNNGGFCVACGKGYACCRAGMNDAPECEKAEIKFPAVKGHQCAKVPKGEPFLGSLRFYPPDEDFAANHIKLRMGKQIIGRFAFSRLRVDITGNGIIFTWGNLAASFRGQWRARKGIGSILRKTRFVYAAVRPGGHGAVVFNVAVGADGKFSKTTLRECRLTVDVTVKIGHVVLGALLDLIMAVLRKFIARKIEQAVCKLFKKLAEKASVKLGGLLS